MKKLFSKRVKAWIGVGILAVLLFIVSLSLLGPPPPRTIRLATGDPDGAYHAFGLEYQQRLQNVGLKVELVNTSGSLENFSLLKQGKVDVAFIQGGTLQLSGDTAGVVRGLASIYWEPLWVFHNRRYPTSTIRSFRGDSISIGPRNSGTAAVAKQILQINGIDTSNASIVNLGMSDARQKLLEKEIDVAFLITAHDNEIIHGLLRTDTLHLMNFRRHKAYTRKLPYLSTVELAEGLLDLENNIPAEDVILLAPAALLAGTENLHAEVVGQLLKVAKTLHGHGTLLSRAGTFPTLEHMDIPSHLTAQTYLKSGESFLTDVLPYRWVALLMRAKLLILPALALLIPFGKVFPLLYRFRVNMLLKKHYQALRDAESEIHSAESVDDLEQSIVKLSSLRDEMERLSRKIPGHLQRDVYNWRLHTTLVEDEARELLEERRKSDS